MAFWAAPGESVNGVTHAPQVELFDRDHPLLKIGSLIWSTSFQSQDTIAPDRPAALKPLGEWNVMEVEVREGSLRVAVNGKDLSRSDLSRLSALRAAHPGLKRRKGRIGFQSHTGKVKFRNIEIKELTAAGTGGLSITAVESPDRTLVDKPPVLPAAAVFRGHSYKFFREVMSWHEAKRRCEGMGGHLATIEDSAENEFIGDLAKQSLPEIGNRDGVWLGGTDELREGRWVWIDGTEMRFQRWGAGQPNNKPNAEHYMVFLLNGHTWSEPA